MEVFPFTHPLHPLNQNPDCNPLCNACHYKTLNYLTQIERKQLWAHKQLSQWDKHLRSIKHAPPHRHLGYRSKTWLRTRIQDNNLSFGMLKSVKIAGIWEKEFIAWNTCPLHSPAITGFIEKFRKIFALLPLKIRHRMENNLMGIWIGEPHLVFISKTSELLEDLKNIGWSTLLSPSLNRVWFHVHDQVGRRVFGHLPIERIAGTNETPTHPIRAFRQVADELLTEARAKAVSALLKDQPQLVLDLYCGTGDLALLLPKQTSWIGIEMSQEAVHYANSLRQPTLSRHQAYIGAVEQRLLDPRVRAQIQSPYVLYLNPPRSGLSSDAISVILKLIEATPPQRIVYLSCSASSLARDLKKFESQGYRVQELQPYDFFPQTEHFETLAILVRS